MRGGVGDGADSDNDEDDFDEHVAELLAAHGAAAGGDVEAAEAAEAAAAAEAAEGGIAPTGNWPDERLDKPLYPNCTYSVRQFVYALHREKQLGTMHDDCCERICKLFSKVLPEGNDAPKCALRTSSASTQHCAAE